MEKTRRASVLEVDFIWSDVGAWDAVAAFDVGRISRHIFEDADGCLVRAPDGVMVAAMGVSDLAIVVEPDAVLVCDLARAQDVQKVVHRIRATSPRHLDFDLPDLEAIEDGTPRLAEWLRLRALPTWATFGQDVDGAFADAMTLDVGAVVGPRRARVQARQIFVYSQAGIMGWTGPWHTVVERGLDYLYKAYLRKDGLCRATLTVDGQPLDDTAMVYDQAFVMFALAAARRAGLGESEVTERAAIIRDHLIKNALSNGALRESGKHPYQSNAHMHLFEAALAWEQVGEDHRWRLWSDRLAQLACETFIDAKGGFLREFFRSDWRPAAGQDGRLVEPGHQFEWAWLLVRYARARGDRQYLDIARKLYRAGKQGVGNRPVVVVDAMNDDLTLRTRGARLWPQTEWLKAALILSEEAEGEEKRCLMDDAASALRALWLYLTPDGIWRDKILGAENFIDEPSPASSFYHIMAGFEQLGVTQASDIKSDLLGRPYSV